MAEMIPYPQAAFSNESEAELYDAFRSELSGDYFVFHSLRWNTNGNSDKQEVEIDFVILRKGGGILVLEAKGGLWSKSNGRWLCYEQLVDAKDDPAIQSQENRHHLLNHLKGNPDLANMWIPIDHAIALPDTTLNLDQYSDAYLRILTIKDMPYIAEWVEESMDVCIKRSKGRKLNKQDVGKIVRYLCADLSGRLVDALESDEDRLNILTKEQLDLDRLLAKQKRLTVQGCAGSGKTWMALRQVKRLVANPEINHVLLTCYNSELGEWLKKSTAGLGSKCTTSTFLRFCEESAIRAGLLEPVSNRLKDREYFDALPDLLLSVVEREDLKFDAIVVDEGQIFKDDWWVVIELLLAHGSSSPLYIFYDEHQRMYDEDKNHIPGSTQPFELVRNLRNTASIHQEAFRFVPSELRSESNNVQGKPVLFASYSDQKSLRKALSKALRYLVTHGRVSSKDVIILTPKGLGKNSKHPTALPDIGRVSGFDLTPDEAADPKAIRYSSIQRYRGLERRAVILAEFDRDKDIEPFLYLGASRAMSQLVVLASDALSQDVLQSIQAGCEDLGEALDDVARPKQTAQSPMY